MKVAILAGGTGTRFSEETRERPKALVEIGGRPILRHIMMHYVEYGLQDFVIATGYRGEMIERYVAQLPWPVECIDTGATTKTGGRIKRLSPYLEGETFMLTWCDGVSNVNLKELLAFHRAHGRLASVTAVNPPARFGYLDLEDDQVVAFAEKPRMPDKWINGAFFVLEPGILEYIAGDDTEWERAPMEQLAQDGELMAYRHSGFWQCMDTVHDRELLEALWNSGDPPWKVWD